MKLAYCKESVAAADCRRMVSKDMLGPVRDADSIMTMWRKILDEANIPPGSMNILSNALNVADMSLAAYTLSLAMPPDDLKRYKTKEALAHEVVLVMSGIIGKQLPSPWLLHAAEKEPAADTSETAKSSSSGVLRELSMDGTVKESGVLMAEHGFHVNDHVRRKADGESGRIQKIESGRVHLAKSDGTTGRLSVEGFLQGDWSTYTPKAEPELLTDISLHAPHMYLDFQHACLMANMILDMQEIMEKQHGSPFHAKLNAQLKPRKALLAAAFIPRMKLTLVPAAVQIRHGPKKPEDALFTIATGSPDYHFWVQPLVVVPKAEGDAGFINPAFLVQPLTEEENINMEVTYVKGTRAKNVKYPVLRNTADLQKGDILYMLKGKPSVDLEPLVPETPPKKRAKGKQASA